MPLYFAIALALSDPFPFLPPESVCIRRHGAAEDEVRELSKQLIDAECISRHILETYGGTTLWINQGRINGRCEQLRWEVDEAMALRDFWWSCWYARWTKECSDEERFHHAGRCRAYLKDVVYMPRWWENGRR